LRDKWSPDLVDCDDSEDDPAGGATVLLVPNTVGTTTTVTATASEALERLFLRVGLAQN
jgi:hypothetical protein